MPTYVGLRLALSTCALFGILVLPHHTSKLNSGVHSLLLAWVPRLNSIKVPGRFVLQKAYTRLRRKFGRKTTILDLPGEVRNLIYHWTCTPDAQGTVRGAVHLIHINKTIRAEAQAYFDGIEHTIQIGDLAKHDFASASYLGLPCIIKVEDRLEWDLSRLRHVVLEVSIVDIGPMSPDCFDVWISPHGKEQWRHLKLLIGIWPESRETPLESIRLDLKLTQCAPSSKRYRADLIRIIRNFKRTKIWAETGDCSIRKANKSLLLPLVRAFNQGRRNWVNESSEDNNLIVRYGPHYLKDRGGPAEKGKDEQRETYEWNKAKWSINPTDDTTRSDKSVWPEWTGKEAKYISEKMIKREDLEPDRELECRECLAVFARPREMKDHLWRGAHRTRPLVEPVLGPALELGQSL